MASQGSNASTENGAVEHLEKIKFADLSYERIKLPPLCMKVIQTEEVNRLHKIKQLGPCYWVFPCAKHTRFEHSIGTCYLAGKLVKTLRKQQPELKIDNRDVLCVELAALCHDLGHGPMSHTFELFIHATGNLWKHEEASVAMFKRLLTKNPEVKESLDQILQDVDYQFIEELILSQDRTGWSTWQYKGRGEEKSFLYDIVSNKLSGLDVDKIDYLVRDSNLTTVKTNFNYRRLFENAKVIKGKDGWLQIAFRDKVSRDVQSMFEARAALHRLVYRHHTVNAVEKMLVDALVLADPYIDYYGADDSKRMRLSETIHDMDAYVLTDDDAVDGAIMRSRSKAPKMEMARQLLKNIRKRNLYSHVAVAKVVGEANLQKISHDDPKIVEEEIAAQFKDLERSFETVDETRLKENLTVVISDIHCGMKNKNPSEFVLYYKKRDRGRYIKRPDRTEQTDYQYKFVRLFCKMPRQDNPKLFKCAEACFDKWISENDFTTEMQLDEEEDEVPLERLGSEPRLQKRLTPYRDYGTDDPKRARADVNF